MVNYRRHKPDNPDAVFFLTLATKNRVHFFRNRDDYLALWKGMQHSIDGSDAVFKAWALLPDHLHWLLAPCSEDYSKVVTRFKRWTLAEFRKYGQIGTDATLWQPRFWEHTIRSQDDYNRCVEYIHWNAVKHEYCTLPEAWPYSSFPQFVNEGIYPKEWRVTQPPEVHGAEWD